MSNEVRVDGRFKQLFLLLYQYWLVYSQWITRGETSFDISTIRDPAKKPDPRFREWAFLIARLRRLLDLCDMAKDYFEYRAILYIVQSRNLIGRAIAQSHTSCHRAIL